MPFLAGVPVRTDLVRLLVTALVGAGEQATAAVLQSGIDRGRAEIPLTDAQRLAILNVLTTPEPGLAELRDVLLDEHARLREGLTPGPPGDAGS
jgi:hypothetical protein